MSDPVPNKAKTTQTVKDIPDELKLEIFHKLPLKSLLRFSCLSKTWHSLIINPTVNSILLNRPISSPHINPLLLICFGSEGPPYLPTQHYSIHHDDENFHPYKHLPFPFKTHNPHWRIVGTLNGLICFFDYVTTDIIIWNPLIRRSVTLPKPSIKPVYQISLGFAFDSIVKDYKLLRIVKPSRNPDANLLAELYSLNTNSWKRIGGLPVNHINMFQTHAFVNGVLHCMASATEGDTPVQPLILGFDVRREVFNLISFPGRGVNGWLPLFNVVVRNKSIAVIQERGKLPKYIWVMETYGSVKSWKVISSLDRPEFVRGFRKNGELFIHTNLGLSSVVIDGSQKPKLLLGGIGAVSYVDYFFKSMELLDNGNAVNDAPANVDNANDVNDANAVNDAPANVEIDAVQLLMEILNMES